MAANGWESALFVDAGGDDGCDINLLMASQNLAHAQVLPEEGANVYDIVRYEHLVLTAAAVESLQKRLVA